MINCSYLDDCEQYFILGGLDLKLFDLNLNLIDEHLRKTKDNTIKFMTLIKNDKLAVATNSDIEIYALVCLTSSSVPIVVNQNEAKNEKKSFIRIKELKKYVNTHEDSVLCLEKISDSMFASGSANGHFILWQSDTLIKILDLRPFDELNINSETNRYALTSITCFRCLYKVKLFLLKDFSPFCGMRGCFNIKLWSLKCDITLTFNFFSTTHFLL